MKSNYVLIQESAKGRYGVFVYRLVKYHWIVNPKEERAVIGGRNEESL